MKRILCLGEGYVLARYRTKHPTIRYTSALVMALFMCLIARGQDTPRVLPITGTVVDTVGQPIQGATVSIKGTSTQTQTDEYGRFALRSTVGEGTLRIRFVGYEDVEVLLSNVHHQPLHIIMHAIETVIEEVEVNTGFQILSSKYTTGSYTHVDNDRLNRSASTNLLDRLANVTSGLLFKSAPSTFDAFDISNIQIRGRNTLGGYSEPLVVVDNFPYDGDLSNINPADIEDITVLKDAAAAAAWGARSGNGVIVITTKKGSLNSRSRIDIDVNTNIRGKPDLFAPGLARLSSAEYIEVEEFLYSQGAYNARINGGYQSLSPAVEIFHAAREGKITPQDSVTQIARLRQQDSRNELLKYYYRNAINQQYHGNVRGGGNNYAYFASAGYDRNMGGIVNNADDRVTLNLNQTYTLIANRLQLTANVVYTATNSERGEQIGVLYPYDRFADDDGNPMALAHRSDNLRLGYLDTAGGGRLVDWYYRPLEELNRGPYTKTTLQDYRLNTALEYQIWGDLKLSMRYSFAKGLTQTITNRSLESYYTRNLINRFTQIEGSNAIRPIPLGDIYSSNLTDVRSSNGRAQLDYNKSWRRHKFNAIGGFEIRDHKYFNSSYRLYGYNPSTASHQNAAVNYTEIYPYHYGSGSGRIETGSSQFGNVDRFVSMYSNASYSYLDRYLITVSARRDESNIFGVDANQKGVPLWSAGLGWVVSDEPFYNVAWSPFLKLRMSYGYTGNVDKGLSALLTAQATSSLVNIYRQLYASILNPPNPSLRWERVRNINLGADFSLFEGRLSGNIDVWRKRGLDLIGQSPLAPQTGVYSFTGNTAETSSRGFDVQLTSNNVNGTLKWSTTLLHSHSQDEVKKYYGNPGNNYTVIASNTLNPLEGYPYYALFSFRYVGLDEYGDPVGFLDGEPSNAYSNIYNSSNRDNLVYHGSRVPTHFGSLINDFSWRGLGISFSLTYRLGYYFRRNSLNNSTIYGVGGSVDVLQADYANRWQKPGDEHYTLVPKLVYPSDFFRSLTYAFSDALIERGDHIRLQDLRISYAIPTKRWITRLELFAYANNLGVIWRANGINIDPDYPLDIPPAKSFAFGLKATL